MRDLRKKKIRIAEINMMHIGSTGRIMFGIAQVARGAQHEVRTFSPVFYQRNGKADFPEIKDHTYFGSSTESFLHLRLSQITGLHGCFSYFGTRKLIRELRRFQPEIVHLHNLHNWSLNYSMLFGFLKKVQVPVIWTLHDCWGFTGHCPHFAYEKCEKWKTGCRDCPRYSEYPKSLLDNSQYMYRLKRKWFTGNENIHLAVPSNWLSSLIKESFLKEYPVAVIPNGIDLSVFSPAESHVRERYGLQKKHIVLGVASSWGDKKGLDVFIALAKSLGDDYQIILVGTDEWVDRQLPENILSIHRTQNQRELAAFYGAADVFVNPTREDTFPTVNLEALACGTPVVTFETGGSPECLDDHCGIVVPCDDREAMEQAIRSVCQEKPFSREDCVKRGSCFSREEKFREYVQLYEKVLK